MTGTGGALGSGTLVAVVGPSGAGKDTLISEVMAHFGARPDLHLAQRVITRPEDAGGEAHCAVDCGQFEALKRAGHFAVEWEAHGLCYGIPAAIRDWLQRGDVVIANGSRSALPHFAQAFETMLVVNIVATPDVLANRLQARGRECRSDILLRLQRSSLEVRGDYNVLTIDNSGDLATAAAALISALSPLLKNP